jgi:diguanylate cyclase (GGDEF)-like protein
MGNDRPAYDVDPRTAGDTTEANQDTPTPQRDGAQPSAPAKSLEHEKLRLDEIRRYQIMDTPPEENFNRLVRLASFICGTPTSLMSLLDDSRQWFKAKIGFEPDEKPRSIAFCAHAIESNEDIMVVEDAARDARFADNPLVTGEPHIRFYAGAPMRSSAGASLGTICVIDSNPRELTELQRSLLTDLAALAVDEMELRLKNRQLLEMTQVDAMTGAHSRAFFLERAQSEGARSARYSRPLGVLAFDIDRFKSVNDTWGHAAGDAALCAVVDSAQETLRTSDVLARMGGEEFSALLPETDLEGSRRIAERLRVGIEKLELHHEGAVFSVTVSIGLALFKPGATIDDVMKRADDALYKAKREGRNRIVLAENH